MPDIATCAVLRKYPAPAPNVGDVADLPVGFDAATFPILAEHWFGWRPIGDVAAVIVCDLRSGCQAKRQYAESLG